MISKKVLAAWLLGGFAATVVYGQHGILGGSGTYCRDGWKFSATYALEPWSPAHQHVNIEGLSEVMHTDAKDGRPDMFHRVFVDPVAETYWGYDLEVKPLGETGTAQLRFKPLTLNADQLPKDYHPRHVPNVATFHALPPPQLPSGTFESGEVIAVEVMRNPATGQKVVDYIEVEFEPVYAEVKAEPRDYKVSDALLQIANPSLRVNGVDVAAALTIADRSLKSPLVWLSVPGHGRFLLSLCSHTGAGFQKAGVVSAFGLSFSWNGDRFDLLSRTQITEPSGNWNLYVLPAPSSSADVGQGFAYGELNTLKGFVSRTQ
jgi:catechol 2,3-dioxygenase-like lactoylglutathione lyase family enzyme